MHEINKITVNVYHLISIKQWWVRNIPSQVTLLAASTIIHSAAQHIKSHRSKASVNVVIKDQNGIKLWYHVCSFTVAWLTWFTIWNHVFKSLALLLYNNSYSEYQPKVNCFIGGELFYLLSRYFTFLSNTFWWNALGNKCFTWRHIKVLWLMYYTYYSISWKLRSRKNSLEFNESFCAMTFVQRWQLN